MHRVGQIGVREETGQQVAKPMGNPSWLPPGRLRHHARLRAWLGQRQNRKRERPGDGQELEHRGQKLTLQRLLSLEGHPEAPGPWNVSPALASRREGRFSPLGQRSPGAVSSDFHAWPL